MDDEQTPDLQPRKLTRREALALAGGATVGLTLGSGLGLPALATSPASAASLSLTPEQEEGPYYVDLERVRRKIAEGQAGVPLTLAVRVLHATSGAAIAGAAVDVWHCSALGVYSDESVEQTVGKTFLRGVQLTDSAGTARFVTVYPGHYAGRAVHVHVKLHVSGELSAGNYSGGHVCHTGQLFFDDAISSEVFRLSPYARNTVARVLNRADGVYTGQGGARSLVALRKLGRSIARNGFHGSATLVVDPDATPAAVGVAGGSAPGGSAPGA
jgi:protocatechuate 3,4-dioxygenase beta subunit